MSIKMDFVLLCSLVALSGVAVKPVSTQLEEITATEGDSVTLASGVDIGIHGTLTDDNGEVLLSLENELDSVQNNHIHWVSGSRSIVMKSVQKEDSKAYHLQTFPNGKKKNTTIRLNVTERQHQVPVPSSGPTTGSITAQRIPVAVSVSLSLMVVSAFALIIYFKTRKPVSSASTAALQVHQPSTEEPHCCINVTGADSSDSTSSSDSVEEPEMEQKNLMPEPTLNG